MAIKNIDLNTSGSSFLNRVGGEDVPVTDICCGQDTLHFRITPYTTCEIIKCYIVEQGNYLEIPLVYDNNQSIVVFDKTIIHDNKTSISTQSFDIHIIFANENQILTTYVRKYQMYVYLPSFVNIVNNVKVIDAQMVDNDNNHILFISENNDNNIFINKLKQTANRKILYQRKKVEKTSVIATNTPQILEGNRSQYYAPQLRNDMDVIFTPISAYINNSWSEPKSIDYNQLPGNVDKLIDLMKK